MSRRNKWGGSESRKARAMWEPRLPVPCCRCGKPVVPDPTKKAGGWHPDHYPIPREFGGTETWPSHDHCNLSDGGKRGAAIVNARRAASRPIKRADERLNNIRGV